MRYLAGTQGLSIVFGGDGALIGKGPELNPIDVVAYADADWGGDKDDRKSTTGYVVKMDGNTVIWSAKKQKTVALSTAEAEYMAIAGVTQEVKWLNQLLSEMGFPTSDSGSQVLTDNQAALTIGTNDTYHERTKHIDIKYHFIRESVKNKEIDLKWIPTKNQLADIFTKAVSSGQFIALRSCVMIHYYSIKMNNEEIE
jgi:hypothetical protein